MKTLSQLALLVLLVFGAAACDSNDADDDGPDTFGDATVKATGAITKEFSGHAIFAVEQDGGETYFTLLLADNLLAEEAGQAVLFQRAGARPAAGAYTIDGDDVYSFYMAENGEDDYIVGGDAGQFTVTRSTNDMIEGTFSFSGILLGTDDDAVTITGSFRASKATDVPGGLSKLGQ